jgi:hypothetical protein
MVPNEKFLELAKKYEDLKEQMESVREELNSVMKELGEGYHCQDHKTMLVYKIVKHLGKFIKFQDIDFHRTRKTNEKSGSLSKKEAEGLGYAVL